MLIAQVARIFTLPILNMQKQKEQTAGFTLLELLIAIAIVGVLSALLLASFIGVRAKGRDAQRKADIRQLQTALQLYYSDQNAYPVQATLTPAAPGGVALNAPLCTTPAPLANGPRTYLRKIPCDPMNDTTYWNGGKYYYYSSDGLSYDLTACLESNSDNEGQYPSGNDCPSGAYYHVHFP